MEIDNFSEEFAEALENYCVKYSLNVGEFIECSVWDAMISRKRSIPILVTDQKYEEILSQRSRVSEPRVAHSLDEINDEEFFSAKKPPKEVDQNELGKVFVRKLEAFDHSEAKLGAFCNIDLADELEMSLHSIHHHLSSIVNRGMRIEFGKKETFVIVKSGHGKYKAIKVTAKNEKDLPEERSFNGEIRGMKKIPKRGGDFTSKKLKTKTKESIPLRSSGSEDMSVILDGSEESEKKLDSILQTVYGVPESDSEEDLDVKETFSDMEEDFSEENDCDNEG